MDTGGTFTDGHARDPQGGQHRCKVLSSGQWRTRLLELADGGRRLRVEGAAALPQAHWLGFQVQALEAASASAPQRRASKVLPASAAPAGRASLRLVQGHKPGSSWLELDQAVDWPVGSLLELFTGEEAAVLAARVLTGTAALLPLPPMRLRVATTRATNALLEGKVGAVALWVTQGFGDLVWIGDQRRRDLFALWQEPRVCLQREVVEVAQRVAVDGRVLAAPRKAEVMRAARRCGRILTVEDHGVVGGVGGAVVEALSEVRNVAIRVHGVRGYGESGLGHELYAKHGLDASGIARVARDFVRSDSGR